MRDNDLNSTINGQKNAHTKKPFLIRLGSKVDIIESKGIAYFSLEGGRVYLRDLKGRRFPLDLSFEQLENLVESEEFFRINEEYLVHHQMITKIEEHITGQVEVFLKKTYPSIQKEDKLSLDMQSVASFKKWYNSK